jgi:Autophagocytosis associated protein, active-site domain
LAELARNSHQRLVSLESEGTQEDEVVELQEDTFDDEEFVRSGSKREPSPSVEYHIVYSTSYRVPILHFSFHDLPSFLKASDLNTVYAVLVPSDFHDALKGGSVVGGVTRGVCITLNAPEWILIVIG